MKEILESTKQLLKLQLLEAQIEIAGLQIAITTSKTGNGGIRYWFLCPISGKRCSILYEHPLTGQIGSRESLGIKYRKSAQKGMVETQIINLT